MILDVDKVIDGDAEEVIVKVTAIVFGLLLAADDTTETVAVYVPTDSDPVVTCKVIVAGAVVVFSDAVNHPAPDS